MKYYSNELQLKVMGEWITAAVCQFDAPPLYCVVKSTSAPVG